MKRLFSLFFACVTACVLLVTSCEAVGLGQEVDLEAPVLTVLKLKSGEQVLDSFSGGVYCKRTRAGEDLGAMSLEAFLEKIREEIQTKK